MYQFKEPLIKGKLLKRKSQFTALVDIDGEELIVHIPTTNRIRSISRLASESLRQNVTGFLPTVKR